MEADHVTRHGPSGDRDLLSWSTVVPVVDLSRRGQRFASTFAKAAERIAASGSFLLGTELSAFESEFAEWLGAAALRRGVLGRGGAAAGACCGGNRRRRRSAGAGVHGGAHRVGSRGDRSHTAGHRRRPEHRVHHDRHGRGGAHTAHQGRDRRPPLRLSRRAARRPTCWSSKMPRRRTARCTTRPIGGHGLQLLPHQEPRRHRRRRRGRHRRRRPRRARPHAARARHDRSSTCTSTSRRTSGCRRSRRRGCGSRSRELDDRHRHAAERSPRATARPRRDLRWQADHPRHAYHLAVFRTRRPRRVRAPRWSGRAWRPRSTTRWRSRSSRHTATCTTRRARRPRHGRRNASACRAFRR